MRLVSDVCFKGLLASTPGLGWPCPFVWPCVDRVPVLIADAVLADPLRVDVTPASFLQIPHKNKGKCLQQIEVF